MSGDKETFQHADIWAIECPKAEESEFTVYVGEAHV